MLHFALSFLACQFPKEVTLRGQECTNQPNKPKLLQQVRLACKRRQYSPRTASSYVYWYHQYILFHKKQYPKTLDKRHVESFLNYLVTQRRLSASFQSQALNAIIFMYKQVLEQNFDWLNGLVRAKRKKFLATVLSVKEIRSILNLMSGTTKIMAELIYGTGMHVNECIQLRVKDIDFSMKTIMVRQGKGGKARMTLLPERLIEPLQ